MIKRYKPHKDEHDFACMRDTDSGKLNYIDNEYVTHQDYKVLQEGIKLIIADKNTYIEECQILKNIRDANTEMSWYPDDKARSLKVERLELDYSEWKKENGL